MARAERSETLLFGWGSANNQQTILLIWSCLLGLGLVMVYSATIGNGPENMEVNINKAQQHAAHIVVGVLIVFGVRLIPVKFWSHISKPLLVLGLLSLLAVLVMGITTNGSTRWLTAGQLRLQPAEFLKVIMVIYAASYLIRKRDELANFTQGVVMIGLVLAVTAALLLRQPDFGSFVVIIVTVGLMMFMGGIRFWHFMLCVLFGVLALAVMTLVSPYRLERVTSFMNPWADPYDTGFQLTQSLIAFGRGEWSGAGLGASIQKLDYLPHAENDFLFAIIAEELGFVGVVAVIILFGLMMWTAFRIARHAEYSGDLFGARLAQGLGLLLVIQALINIGVNLGVLPTKGLTLPFMSYGGTSMLACSWALGLLLAIDRATARPGRRLP